MNSFFFFFEVNRRGRGPYWKEYIKRISLVKKEEKSKEKTSLGS
jgi:hypothetical protein